MTSGDGVGGVVWAGSVGVGCWSVGGAVVVGISAKLGMGLGA